MSNENIYSLLRSGQAFSKENTRTFNLVDIVITRECFQHHQNSCEGCRNYADINTVLSLFSLKHFEQFEH